MKRPAEVLADVKVHTERPRGDALLEAIKDADATVVMRDGHWTR